MSTGFTVSGGAGRRGHADDADTRMTPCMLDRHAMLVDQRTEGVAVPLNLALECEGRLELANSSLSEMAVLGVRECGIRITRRGGPLMLMPILMTHSLNMASAGRSPICCPFGRLRSVPGKICVAKSCR